MNRSDTFTAVFAAAIVALTTTQPVRAEVIPNVFGRLQLDMAQYNSDVTELGSGTEMRRARIGVDGKLDTDWAYKVEIDFADGDLVVKDANLRHGWLTIGQYMVPQSLQAVTSSKYMTFIERAAVVDTLTLGRRMGMGANFSGDNWTAAVAGFGQNADVQDGGKDEGVGISARLTGTVWNSDRGKLHLGVWGSWEQPQNTVEKTVRLRARPESHVTAVRLIDTGTIDNLDNMVKMGLEGALVLGSLSVQGEYLKAELNRSASDPAIQTPNLAFDGYYVQASYMTGGNSRAYKGGSYGRTMASKAWEFAIRYSKLDLTETAGVIPGKGGEQNVLTLGVNYYINPQLRVMANYLDIQTRGYNDGSTNESPSALQMRVAFDF